MRKGTVPGSPSTGEEQTTKTKGKRDYFDAVEIDLKDEETQEIETAP